MTATSPRPGRSQCPGRPGRADPGQQLELALMRLDALAEAVRLLAGDATGEDPAYEAAVAVQARRRGMHVVGGRG